MDIITAVVLNVVLFAVGMLVLFYVVRAAVRDGIGLADRDRERRRADRVANEIATERERDAERRAIEIRAERERSGPQSEPSGTAGGAGLTS